MDLEKPHKKLFLVTLELSGHRTLFFLVKTKFQESYLFLVARPLYPPPPLSGRATKKR